MPVPLGALELEWRETRRAIDHVMRIVEVPVEGGDPLFGPQALVEVRPGQRGQDEQLRARELHLAGEANRGLDRVPVVLLEAEYEHAVDVDPGFLDDTDSLAGVLP